MALRAPRSIHSLEPSLASAEGGPAQQRRHRAENRRLGDLNWMKRLRAASLEESTRDSAFVAPKLVPRIVLELSADQQKQLAKSSKMQALIVKKVVELCSNEFYDGIVLEATDFHALARQQGPNLIKAANEFTIRLGQVLHEMSPPRLFILVVRPYFERSPYFQHSDAAAVDAAVDYYSLMTYDFSSSSNKPGPNAPLSWMKTSVQKFVGERSSNATRARVFGWIELLWSDLA